MVVCQVSFPVEDTNICVYWQANRVSPSSVHEAAGNLQIICNQREYAPVKAHDRVF